MEVVGPGVLALLAGAGSALSSSTHLNRRTALSDLILQHIGSLFVELCRVGVDDLEVACVFAASGLRQVSPKSRLDDRGSILSILAPALESRKQVFGKGNRGLNFHDKILAL